MGEKKKQEDVLDESLIILVLIFAIVGCADDDKGSKSSNYIQDNTSYDNNTGYTYHVIIDSVSHISKDDNMSQWGCLLCDSYSALTNILADKLGRPTENTTKIYYVDMSDIINMYDNYGEFVLYDNNQCNYYYGNIFTIKMSPHISTSIYMQYFINQIKTNPYENRYQEDVCITVDENDNIVEIK